MPRHTRRAGSSAEMSSPSKMMRPDVGVRKPLISVEERGLAGAVRPDHRAQFAGLDRHRHVVDGDQAAEMLGDVFDLQQAHDATFRRIMPSTPRGKNKHDQHEDQSHERHPVLGVAGDVIRQHDEYRGADQRAPERAHAAEHRHDDEIAGLVPAQRARIDEIVEQSVKRAGEADEAAGNHPGQPDMPVHRNAEEAGAALVLADRKKRAAERRAQEERHDPDRGGEERQRHVVERLVVVEDVERGKAEMRAARGAMPTGRRRRR